MGGARADAVAKAMEPGRVGYIHIPSMDEAGLEQFVRSLYSDHFDKEAVVIDVRHNSGGFTHDQVLNYLAGKEHTFFKQRDGGQGLVLRATDRKWTKPMVVMAGTTGRTRTRRIFPHAFRALGLEQARRAGDRRVRDRHQFHAADRRVVVPAAAHRGLHEQGREHGEAGRDPRRGGGGDARRLGPRDRRPASTSRRSTWSPAGRAQVEEAKSARRGRRDRQHQPRGEHARRAADAGGPDAAWNALARHQRRQRASTMAED